MEKDQEIIYGMEVKKKGLPVEELQIMMNK